MLRFSDQCPLAYRKPFIHNRASLKIVFFLCYAILARSLPDQAFGDTFELVNNGFQFPPSSGLENPYTVYKQSDLDVIGNDPTSIGLAEIFNNTYNQEVEVRTSDGQWISSLYLPDGTQISNLSKFQLTVRSTFSVTIYYNNGESKKIKTGETLILALIKGVWLDEEGYEEIATLSPSFSSSPTKSNPPTSTPTTSRPTTIPTTSSPTTSTPTTSSPTTTTPTTSSPSTTPKTSSPTIIKGLPNKVFWDNDWPSDLVNKIGDDGDNNYFQFPPSSGLENPYIVSGQSNLDNIGNDPTSVGLVELFNNIPNQEVEVRTFNGSWISNMYLPDSTQISNLSKFQVTVGSSWGVNVFYNNGESKRINFGEKLILALIEGVWLNEEGYNEIATSAPSLSPTTEEENESPELLAGTVLFAQSQIIPSKHGNDGDDTQPHLTAMRKTLVMLKPHKDNLPGDEIPQVIMTVHDGDGNIISSSNVMNTPENIPKHDSWIDLGEGVNYNDIEFPPSLTNSYVIKGKSNLNVIGNDEDAVALTRIMNEDDKHEVEIQTKDGSWVKHIYFPKGADVAQDCKIQITCDSGYNVIVHYPKPNGGWRTKTYRRGATEISILVNSIWVAENDLEHNEYIFGHGFYTATLERQWVQPGMTLEFTTIANDNVEYVGILDEIDVGAPTELMITTLDAGFLTEPRNEFTFKDDFATHREYFETAPLSRLIVVQYETMHLTEIMLPDGTLYTDVSDDNGGWHSGDMRQYIGKILLSHGIDLANYGINSSKGNKESSHPFTCALLAAHNTVGLYQNGRIVHGGSGGNGMVTLDSSIGNEFSHEVGHNYGLGHYVDGFKGSVHRPASAINSSWGWDSEANVFIPNFSTFNSGKDQCLENQCQSAYLGKYQYNTDSMAGGGPQYSSRFTLYTPNTSRIIQNFLEKKAVWDPSSSTGFRKFNTNTKQMDEFANNANDNRVPIKYRVPVTTIVGFYDPDSNRRLDSYIYPAMHGAFGFVYDNDNDLDDGDVGCKLVVATTTNTNTPLQYSLSASVFSSTEMNKFHVNIATEDEPFEASIYCENELLVSRALDGPRKDNPPLEYTVTGVPFTSLPTSTPTTLATKTPTLSPTSSSTRSPTSSPTKAPTRSPTLFPTTSPTSSPTKVPTRSPTFSPTKVPTKAPMKDPTHNPTFAPTKAPIKTPTVTCAILGKKNKIKKFCNKAGRIKGISKFPIFWEFDMSLTNKELSSLECKSDLCTAADCCKVGRERKCSSTDNKGNNKPFQEEQCDDGFVLHSEKKLEKKKCTGNKGKKCLSKNCCKKKKK